MQEMGLHELENGEQATIIRLHTRGSMRRRLLDLGFVEHGTVTCVGRAPSGDPLAFWVRGAVIALRREDCQPIIVRRGCSWD